MNPIAEKLRAAEPFAVSDEDGHLMVGAAAEIERLESALSTINGPDDTGDDSLFNVRRLRAELARAKAALAAKEKECQRLFSLVRSYAGFIGNTGWTARDNPDVCRELWNKAQEEMKARAALENKEAE